jgi:hypothetical protein
MQDLPFQIVEIPLATSIHTNYYSINKIQLNHTLYSGSSAIAGQSDRAGVPKSLNISLN